MKYFRQRTKKLVERGFLTLLMNLNLSNMLFI